MKITAENNINTIVLGFICLAVFILLLIAGLWPFNFHPENKVMRIANPSGIRFYGQGSVNSILPLDFSKDDSYTIEICLMPKTDYNSGLGRIISFYDYRKAERFFLGQWRTNIIMRNFQWTEPPRWRERDVNLKNSLGSIMLTVTGNRKTTTVYINGMLVEQFSDFSLMGNTDEPVFLLLGNSPAGQNYWAGDVFSLAIYNREFNKTEAAASFTNRSQRNSVNIKGLSALYLFDEKTGTAVRDMSGFSRDLIMPTTFNPLKKTILSSPVQDFQWSRWYVKDFFINLAGFMPFGFLSAMLLRRGTTISDYRTGLIVIIAGSVISLSIEAAQIYLPTRNSSLTDLILNIMGTAIGYLLYRRCYHVTSPTNPT